MQISVFLDRYLVVFLIFLYELIEQHRHNAENRRTSELDMVLFGADIDCLWVALFAEDGKLRRNAVINDYLRLLWQEKPFYYAINGEDYRKRKQ